MKALSQSTKIFGKSIIQRENKPIPFLWDEMFLHAALASRLTNSILVGRSVSFILATGATSFFLFAVCYLLTDVLDWWNGAPFFYPGNNPATMMHVENYLAVQKHSIKRLS